MNAWLVSRDDYMDDYNLESWHDTREAAERWILEHPPTKYDWLNLYELLPDGTVNHVERVDHVSGL